MSGMDVTASEDKESVVITVAASSPAAGALRIPRKNVRHLIAYLQAAFADDEGGTLLSSSNEDEEESTPSISIADATDTAGFAVLTLVMGPTYVSIGIPKDCLSQVGTTFLTMSADKTIPQ